MENGEGQTIQIPGDFTAHEPDETSRPLLPFHRYGREMAALQDTTQDRNTQLQTPLYSPPPRSAARGRSSPGPSTDGPMSSVETFQRLRVKKRRMTAEEDVRMGDNEEVPDTYDTRTKVRNVEPVYIMDLISENTQQKKDIEEAQEQNSVLQEQVNGLSEQISNLSYEHETEVSKMKESIQALQKERAVLKESLKSAQIVNETRVSSGADTSQIESNQEFRTKIEAMRAEHDLNIIAIRREEWELRNQAVEEERLRSERATQNLKDNYSRQSELQVANEQMSYLQKDKDDCENEICELKKESDKLREDLTRVKEQLRASHRAQAARDQELSNLKDANNELEDRILDLKDEVDDLREKLGRAEDGLEERQTHHSSIIDDLKHQHQADIATHLSKINHLTDSLKTEEQNNNSAEDRIHDLKDEVHDLLEKLGQAEDRLQGRQTHYSSTIDDLKRQHHADIATHMSKINHLTDSLKMEEEKHILAQNSYQEKKETIERLKVAVTTIKNQLQECQDDNQKLQDDNAEAQRLRQVDGEKLEKLEAELAKTKTDNNHAEGELKQEVESLEENRRQILVELAAERSRSETTATDTSALIASHAKITANWERKYQRTLEQLKRAMEDKQVIEESRTASETAQGAELQRMETEKRLLQEKYDNLRQEFKQETDKLRKKENELQLTAKESADKLHSLQVSLKKNLSESKTKLEEAQNELLTKTQSAEFNERKLHEGHDLREKRLKAQIQELQKKLDSLQTEMDTHSREHEMRINDMRAAHKEELEAMEAGNDLAFETHVMTEQDAFNKELAKERDMRKNFQEKLNRELERVQSLQLQLNTLQESENNADAAEENFPNPEPESSSRNGLSEGARGKQRAHGDLNPHDHIHEDEEDPESRNPGLSERARGKQRADSLFTQERSHDGHQDADSRGHIATYRSNVILRSLQAKNVNKSRQASSQRSNSVELLDERSYTYGRASSQASTVSSVLGSLQNANSNRSRSMRQRFITPEPASVNRLTTVHESDEYRQSRSSPASVAASSVRHYITKQTLSRARSPSIEPPGSYRRGLAHLALPSPAARVENVPRARSPSIEPPGSYLRGISRRRSLSPVSRMSPYPATQSRPSPLRETSAGVSPRRSISPCRSISPRARDRHSPTPGPSRPTNFTTQPLTPERSNNVTEIQEHIRRLEQEVNNLKRPSSSKQKFDSFTKGFSPRPRSTEKTKIMSFVRVEMNQLFGITIDRDIVNVVHDHAATDNDVSKFQEDKSVNTLAPFKPYFSIIKSPWNYHLADEFVSHFLELYPEYNNELARSTVHNHFFSRLTSLRVVMSSHLPKNGESQEETTIRLKKELEQELQMKRHRTRQIKGFERRQIDTAIAADDDRSGLMRRVNQAINALGVDGYSSDDTDISDGGTASHIVKTLPWRNPKLIRVVIRRADGCHPLKNINGNRTSGSDQTPRVRARRNGPISDRKPPRGQPHNFYAPVWYAGLTESERVHLDAQPDQAFPGEEDDDY